MPPRIPFLAALGQPFKLLRTQTAQLTTSAPSQAVRRDVAPTSTSQLLDLGSSSSSSNVTRDSTKGASDLYAAIRPASERRQGGGRHRRASRLELEADLRLNHAREDYSRQMTRRWKTGDVYAPHDLSPSEMAKFRNKSPRKRDLVDVLGLKPLDMYRNFSMVSEFVTAYGFIQKGSRMGLRPVNQRKVAKAIRRAMGLGLHPSVHRHPELILRDMERLRPQKMESFDRSKFM